MLVCVALAGCGTAGGSPSGGSSGSSGSSNPPTITVTISPLMATLYFGQQKQFTVTVSGTSNTAVDWAVNGVAGGDTSVGTISAQGIYTAPNALPSSNTVTITATSQADSTVDASATVALASDIQVTISPATVSVTTGSTQQFTAQVSGTGTPSLKVNWSLTGSACPTGCGSLSTNGDTANYTAPAAVPSSPDVQIVATSLADPSKSAMSKVTITAAPGCTPAISISPATASVATGGQQAFTASFCSGTSGSVTWTVNGNGCSTSNCGTVASTGTDAATYTAPASLPPANPVTLVVTSAADPSETASASITVTASCPIPITISPSAATVALGLQQSFTASVCFTSDQSVSWTVAGSGCTGPSCGTVSSTGVNTATYTAPSSLPPSNPVTIVATSLADSSQTGSGSVQVVSGVSVTLNRVAAPVAVNQRVSLAASVQGSTNQAVTWTVEGITNGNATVGEICVAGSNLCSPPSGASSTGVDYLAPSAVPNPSGVYVTAMAAADPSRSAIAEMTIQPHLNVSLAPMNSVVAPSGTVEFAATVTGSENDGVTWQVGCSGNACGTITASGLYTAPGAPTNPNGITITATSQADPTQSATATVALTSGVALSSISPASVTAGANLGFTLAVTGYNFAPSSPGPGTTLLVNGNARPTDCSSVTDCTTAILPADVASADTVEIRAKNPDGSESSALPLVVVPAGRPAAVISLSPSEPVAGDENITAVQPTTDGTGAGPMTLLFLGLVDSNTNTCNVSESPVELARPTSGTTSYTICLGGSSLDPAFDYTIAGSQATDVTVSNPRWFDGSLVSVTVTIASTAAPGPRSLIVADPNKDRAAASGAIDVE